MGHPGSTTGALVEDRLPDPWAVADGPARWATPGWVLPAAALALGAASPVARLAVDGFHGRAAVVALVSFGWLLLIDRRPRGFSGLIVLGVVAVAAALATWTTIGRAPVLVALSATLVAHAALVRWEPLPVWPPRAVPIAGLALFPLVASQILWFREQSPALTSSLLILALLVVEAYHRAPGPVGRVDRTITKVVVGVAGALGSVVLFLVVALLLYLPGMLGAGIERVRRSTSRSSYWVDRTTDPVDTVADARWPFSSAAPRQRRLRNAVGGALVVGLAVVVAVTVTSRRDVERELAELEQADVFERAAAVRFSDLPAYRGLDWADALKREQDEFSNQYLRASDVAGYDVADFAGEFTNVVGGARRTINPPPCDGCPSATVWLAGGSAAFGLGQRDEHTIASELVRSAAADGVNLDVVNLGVPGYTIHQEAQKVISRLDAGFEPPDTVVFYNGYNDVVATVMDSTVNGLRPEQPTLMETDVVVAFTKEQLDPWTAGTPEELGGLAALKYRREAASVTAELRRRGIDAIFVFQPDALASPDQYEAVAGIYELAPRVSGHMDGSLAVASAELADLAIDLRHSLDDEPPVFADLVHTNEVAASVVAGRLLPHLPY